MTNVDIFSRFVTVKSTVKDVQKAWKLFKLQMLFNFIDAYDASLYYKLILSVTFDMTYCSSTNSQVKKMQEYSVLKTLH